MSSSRLEKVRLLPPFHLSRDGTGRSFCKRRKKKLPRLIVGQRRYKGIDLIGRDLVGYLDVGQLRLAIGARRSWHDLSVSRNC